MSPRRLSPSRVAGIAAWTAASLAWGTAAIALSNQPTATEDLAATPQSPTPMSDETTALDSFAGVPSMPGSGLIVLRYTPAERPEIAVVQETVNRPPAPSAVESAPTPAPPPAVTEQSSGS